ncbi:MAG: hypothetical protein Q9213_005674 [Squamulea squamosa]
MDRTRTEADVRAAFGLARSASTLRGVWSNEEFELLVKHRQAQPDISWEAFTAKFFPSRSWIDVRNTYQLFAAQGNMQVNTSDFVIPRRKRWSDDNMELLVKRRRARPSTTWDVFCKQYYPVRTWSSVSASCHQALRKMNLPPIRQPATLCWTDENRWLLLQRRRAQLHTAWDIFTSRYYPDHTVKRVEFAYHTALSLEQKSKFNQCQVVLALFLSFTDMSSDIDVDNMSIVYLSNLSSDDIQALTSEIQESFLSKETDSPWNLWTAQKDNQLLSLPLLGSGSMWSQLAEAQFLGKTAVSLEVRCAVLRPVARYLDDEPGYPGYDHKSDVYPASTLKTSEVCTNNPQPMKKNMCGHVYDLDP